MSKSREQLNNFLKQINIEGKTVLDLGVQDKPTKKLTQGVAKRYTTMDIDPQWNPGVVGDLNMHYSLWEWRNKRKKFDVIFCIETMEHVWNPVQALENIYNLLEKDGVAYVSSPFINLIHDIHDFLRYTFQWYEVVGKKIGFKSVDVKVRTATTGKDQLHDFYKKEGIRMSKVTHRMGYSHHYYDIGYFVILKK